MTTSPPAATHSSNGSNNSNNDPLDTILTLEDQYHQEGYNLGLADGFHAGKLEGRVTGLETGFEKFKQMGMLAGKTAVWAGRLARTDSTTTTTTTVAAAAAVDSEVVVVVDDDDDDDDSNVPIAQKKHDSQSSSSHRLRNHIATLHALSDAQTLSTVNDEDACTAFDDRLKRATTKARVVGNIMGDGKALKEEWLEGNGSDGVKYTEGKKIVDVREW